MTNAFQRISKLGEAANLFLIGGFVSNLGSLVFQLCFSLFALEKGWSLWLVGSVLGTSRLVQVLANLFVGDIGDRRSPRNFLLLTECTGALTDIVMISASLFADSWPVEIFLPVFFFRSIALSLQLPLRAKIGKLLAAHDVHQDRRIAINLNVIAQGTTLFGALFTILLRHKIGFVGVCLFDLFSFSLSALAVLKLPSSVSILEKPLASNSSAWLEKFRHYFNFDRRLFLLDLLICFPVWGTQSLFLRLTGSNQSLLPYCLITYGTAVIVSGMIAKKFTKLTPSPWIWLLQALSFIAMLAFPGQFWLLLAPLFFAYAAYFLMWHLITAEYQVRAAAHSFSALSSARNLTAISIISLGELVVSRNSGLISMQTEILQRVVLCLIGGAAIFALIIFGSSRQR